MKKSSESKKKPYETPSVKRYPLRPEEAVLGFCKNSTSAGSSGGTCFNPTACMSIGS
jgi:hypothetical protein